MILRSYKARYSSGTTQQTIPVNISLTADKLLLDYKNESGISVHEEWTKSNIREKRYSSAIIELGHDIEGQKQLLEITDQEFKLEYDELFRRKKKYNGRLKSFPPFVKVLTILFLLIAGIYVLLIPLLADLAAKAFPKDLEISMGQTMMESVLQGEQVLPKQTKAINQFFRRLHPETSYPVNIVVVKKDISNAFALPGGGMVVYDHIISQMKSADELAALLAHEYSHIELKHTTRGLFRNVAGYLMLSIVFSDFNGIAGILIQHAGNLRNLSYSRSLEKEADENGLMILKEAKINPIGMKKLFEQLKKEEPIEMTEWLSTHPELESRIKTVESFTKENSYLPITDDSLTYYFNKIK
jgi:Zn-dependent protease with chaperone function